jgi:hypothetical protein
VADTVIEARSPFMHSIVLIVRQSRPYRAPNFFYPSTNPGLFKGFHDPPAIMRA